MTNSQVAPDITAEVDPDANLNANSVTLTANGTLDDASAMSRSGAGGIVAGALNIATAKAAVQVNSLIGNGATVNAAGTVMVCALGSNTASADSTGVVAGVLDVAAMFANATASGNYNAYLDTGAVVGTIAQPAGGLNVMATTVDQSTSNVDLSGGGAFSGQGGNATATTNPTINAYLGNNSSVNVTGNVSVTSMSTTQAHANTRGASGGIVDVNESLSNAILTPTINTYIGTKATIMAGGSITVESVHGTAPAQVSEGTFSPSQVSNNVITFTTPDGLVTGDSVTYADNGNPDISPLTNGSIYPVIAVPGSNNQIELGPSFDASTVNTTNNTISFANTDGLQTGNDVIYEDNNGTPIGGLTPGKEYQVDVINPTTISLVDPTQPQPPAPTNFDPSKTVTNNSTFNLSGFTDGEAVTYQGPVPISAVQVSNNAFSVGLDTNGNPLPDNLTSGEAVIYNPVPTTATYGSLKAGATYYVIPVATNEFQLSQTINNLGIPDAPINLPSSYVQVNGNPVQSDNSTISAPNGFTSGQAVTYTVAQNGAAIGGLTPGTTYYVVDPTSTQFQLSATITPGSTPGVLPCQAPPSPISTAPKRVASKPSRPPSAGKCSFRRSSNRSA